MSCRIKKNSIELTQGDTLTTKIAVTTVDGEEYVPDENDVITFTVREKYTDSEPLIVKHIPYDTLVLRVEGEDTEKLAVGEYVYDIEIVMSDGTIDTIINQASLEIIPQVHYRGE